MTLFHPVIPLEEQEMAQTPMEISEGSHQENGQHRRAVCWLSRDLHVACSFQAFPQTSKVSMAGSTA